MTIAKSENTKLPQSNLLFNLHLARLWVNPVKTNEPFEVRFHPL